MAISSRSSPWDLSFPLVLPESVLLAPRCHAALPVVRGASRPGPFLRLRARPHLASSRLCAGVRRVCLFSGCLRCRLIVVLSFYPFQISVSPINGVALSTFFPPIVTPCQRSFHLFLYPLISFVLLRPNFFVVLYLNSTALNGHSYHCSLLYGVIPHI